MLLQQKIMPGGVSSPVRAFKSVGGGPVVFDRVEVRVVSGQGHESLRVSPPTLAHICWRVGAQGAYAYDVDGNKYIDYVGTWGPAICGHANPEVFLLPTPSPNSLRSRRLCLCFLHVPPFLVRGVRSWAVASLSAKATCVEARGLIVRVRGGGVGWLVERERRKLKGRDDS